jgi:uncharacterized membrane protein YdbT with pleckstrin-like domain
MRTKLKQEEQIILVTKKHWLPILCYPVTLMLLSVWIAFKLDFLSLYVFYFSLVACCFLFYRILERACSRWVVTNLRVIEETGIMTRITMECPLDKINNVSYSQNICGRIFGFGTVIIQTAAQHGAIDYSNVHNPQLLKETITTMQEEYKKSAWRTQTGATASILSNERHATSFSIGSELEKLHELKQRGILTENEYVSQKHKIINFNRNQELG